MNPYQTDPASLILAALRPAQAYATPTSPLPSTAMPGVGGSFYGPNHAALSQMLQRALMSQGAAQGQIAGMVQNPALAQRIGGLIGRAYTPPMPATPRLDYTPNWGSNGFLTNTGWGGPVMPSYAGGSSGSGGFLGGGGL